MDDTPESIAEAFSPYRASALAAAIARYAQHLIDTSRLMEQERCATLAELYGEMELAEILRKGWPKDEVPF